MLGSAAHRSHTGSGGQTAGVTGCVKECHVQLTKTDTRQFEQTYRGGWQVGASTASPAFSSPCIVLVLEQTRDLVIVVVVVAMSTARPGTRFGAAFPGAREGGTRSLGNTCRSRRKGGGRGDSAMLREGGRCPGPSPPPAP